jgi:heavy metal sensor kinase
MWYLVVLGVALTALSVGAYYYLARNLYRNLDSSLELRSTQLSSVREVIISVAEGQFEGEIGEVVSFYYYAEGQLTAISPRDAGIPVSQVTVEKALNGESTFTTVATTQGTNLRVYVTPFIPIFQPITAPAPPPPESGTMIPMAARVDVESAAVAIARPTTDIEQALERLIRTFSIVIPLTLLAAAAGGTFLSRRILKPVEEMTRKARRIEEHDLSQRIEVKTKDELGQLASTLNDMIDRLDKAFKRQRQFTGDASHELRAPLTIIDAESSLALQRDRTKNEYRQSLETVAQEAQHMSHIVDQLLMLARADSGQETYLFEPLNVGQLVAKLGSDIEPLCREKGLKYQAGLMANLIIDADHDHLRQSLLNILDNAIRYTPSGGRIEVSVRAYGETALITISDTGPGIPPEDLPHIFDRFYRVDKARSRGDGGSGLGLAIARHIVTAHGGWIEAASTVGEGSTFRLYLPLHKDDAAPAR